MNSSDDVFDSAWPEVYQVQTQAPGPAGSLPITEEMLLNRPSGDLFGLSLNAGMGWNPAEAGGKQFLILSTQGGLRAPDGKPIALGYHTGHWEGAGPVGDDPFRRVLLRSVRRADARDDWYV
jgi:hypothetical protein